MHRHGYKGKKFGREKDQRRALLKGLADSLIIQESIQTTVVKAKEIVPYTEKLITKAKRGSLHDRRQIIASLSTLESAHKLVDEIAPRLKNRTSGHFRIKKTQSRRGDNAQMASVSFVDDLKSPIKTAETKKTIEKPKEKPVKKPAVKTKTTNKAAKK